MSTIGAYEAGLGNDSILNDQSFIELFNNAFLALQGTSGSQDGVTRVAATGSEDQSTPLNGSSVSQVPLSAPQTGLNLTLLLQSIQVKLDEQGIARGKEDVHELAQKNKERHKEVMEAIQRSIAEMERAQKSGGIAKAFGWIAAAATLLAGIAMMAIPGGAPAGAIMLGLGIDQIIGMTTGHSAISALTTAIADGLSKVMGEPANTIVATLIVTAIIIIATAGAGSFSSATSSAGRAASTAATTGKSAASAASTSGQTASAAATATKAAESISRFQVVMHQTRNISLFVSGATQVGGGAANMDAAVHKKEADDAKVEEALVRKVILQNKSYIENAIEHLQALTQNSESTLTQMVNYITQEQETNQKLIRDMA